MPAAIPIAIGAGALVSAGASIYGANKMSNATKSASSAQVEAAGLSAAELEKQGQLSRDFLSSQADKARADIAPFQTTGLAALKQQYDLTNPNSAAFQTQFNTGAGQISSALASKGLLRSGAFGQNLLNLKQSIDQNRFNMLSSISDAGRGASGALANINTTLGNQVASNYNSIGANIAQLYTGTAQSVGNLGIQGAQFGSQGVAGSANAISSGIGNYLNYNLLNGLMAKPAPTTA